MAYLTEKDILNIKKKKKNNISTSSTQLPLQNKQSTSLPGVPTKNQLLKAKNEWEQAKKNAKNSELMLGVVSNPITNTIANTGAEIGKGIMDFGDDVIDTTFQIFSSKYNPFMHIGGNVEGKQRAAQDIIKATDSQKFIDDTLGYGKKLNSGKTVQQTIDDASLVKSTNLGGKIARTIGSQLPNVMLGNTAGAAASTGLMGATSFGSGVEQAYNSGASRGQANLYGLGNAAVETATEWITGGVPGVKSKWFSGLDNLVAKGLGKETLNEVSKSVTKELIQAGYKTVGEGFEEALAEIINPFLKNATYSKGEKINWQNVIDSAVVGAITGGLLNAPSDVSNIKSAVKMSKANNMPIKQESNILPKQESINTVVQNQMNGQLKNTNIAKDANNIIPSIGSIIDKSNIPGIVNNQENYNPSAEDIIKQKKEAQVTNKYNKQLEEDIKIASKEADKILYFDNGEQRNNFKQLLNKYVKSNEIVSHEQLKNDIRSNFSERVVKNINTELKNIKSDVRKYRIKVSDAIKADITDYNNFKKSNFGKIIISNTGQNVDSVYQELSDQYPHVFDKNITNPADQLQRLSDFMGESIETAERYNLDEKTIDEATKYVENFLNNEEDLNTLIGNIEVSPKEIRKEKISQYRDLASVKISNIFDWKDKKMGLSYETNTMERNFKDIIKNDAEANDMIDTYIKPITVHNAEAERFITEYNEKISKLKLSNKESIAVQMMGEFKYNPETELRSEQVEGYIKDNKLDRKKIIDSIETFRSIYDELLPKANKILKEQGYKEIPYRKGYFPHFSEDKPNGIIGKLAAKLGWKFNKNQLPTDIAGLTDIFKPGKTWFRHSLHREGDLTEYNALQGFDNYIRGISDIIYHTEDIQKLRALENEIRYQYSDTGIQEEIDSINNDEDFTLEEKEERIDMVYSRIQNQMPNFVTEIRRYTDNLANKKDVGDRSMEHRIGREAYNTMTNIQSRLSGNMVGLNIRSAMTNFIPITQAYSQVSTKNMLKATQETIKSYYKDDGFAERSTFLTNRTKQADRLYKNGIEKAQDVAGVMFQGIDSLTANIVVRGKYAENIDKGMNEQQAMEDADTFAKNIIGGRDKGSMPTIFNQKNPVVKLFTAFQLEQANQFGYMFKDLPKDMKKEGMAQLTMAFVKMFFGAWLYNKIMKSATGNDANFSPVDIVEDTTSTLTNKSLSAGEKITNVGVNVLGNAPFIGGLIGGGRLPINAAIPNVGTTITSASNLISGEGDKRTSVNNLVKELSKPVIYLVPPFGGGQFKKSVEGLGMYTKDVPGSYTQSGKLRFPVKTDLGSKVQAGLFGQYASKEARDYFDNNRKQLSENQTKQVTSSKDWQKEYELIMKQREYDALGREYEELVKKGKSTKEIQEKINNFWK